MDRDRAIGKSRQKCSSRRLALALARKMGSRALLLVKGLPLPKHHCIFTDFNCNRSSAKLLLLRNNSWVRRNVSTWATNANGSSLEPPDVPRLAETARISLAPHEVEEFAPKIRQVIDCGAHAMGGLVAFRFGQLQAVDLQSVEPAIRADTEGDNFRDDIPETFENREAIIAAVPNYEEPYVKVPKILNKE